MGGMPYPLEKGLFPLVLEHYFNEGLERRCAYAPPWWIFRRSPGPRRRLRAIWRYRAIADELRAARGGEAAIADVTADNSFIHSSLFADAGAQLMTGLQRTLAERWFGMVPVAGTPNTWRRLPTSAWPGTRTLGQWHGYYGNTELIMCESLQRMLEVSLGLDHLDAVPPAAADREELEHELRRRVTRVWPIYVFLTCPQPWFGTWISWQCHNRRAPVRGQVTVLIQSPGHDSPLVPSPIDREEDEPVDPASGLVNPYYLQGRDPTGHNSGYDGIYIDASGAVRGSNPGSAPAPGRSYQGMWTVTHANHDATIVWRNMAEPTEDNWLPGGRDVRVPWAIPPIVTYRCARLDQRSDLGGRTDPYQLDGYFDVVVVSPAARDGGVPNPPLYPITGGGTP